MRRDATMKTIDGKKLNNELRKRELTKAGVSQELGYSPVFISNACARNVINTPATLLLEKLYNIKYEDYAPDKEENESELNESVSKEVSVIPEDFYDKMYQMIYSAVYEAVKKAWSE